MKSKNIFAFILFILFHLPGIQTVFADDPNKASFYHNRFHGQETSNGEIYDKDDFTAAHRTLPFNTLLLVTNKKNKKSVIVRVNDRGPFKRSRVIDLSYAAAKKIGMVPFGVVPVKIEILRFLDSRHLADSLINSPSVWDCIGNKKSLSKNSVFIWRTDNWKHALYMASSLKMELKINELVIKIVNQDSLCNYFLLITGINTKEEASEWISRMRKNGFLHAKIYKPE